MPKITVRAIEAAKFKDESYNLPADRGLYLSVNKSGTKTWTVRFTVKGKQKFAALPLPYGNNDGQMSLAQACEENARIQGLARKGIDFRAYDKAKEQIILEKQREKEQEKIAESKTFSDLFNVWLTDGVSRKDGNAELYRMFHKDVLPLLGNMRVTEIKESDLRYLLRKIVKERDANRVAVRIYKDLVQLFKWAEERQPWRKLLIEGNPAKLIDIKQIISPEYEDIYGKRERILSEDEIRELNSIFIQTTKDFKDAYAKEKQSMIRPFPKESQLAC